MKLQIILVVISTALLAQECVLARTPYNRADRLQTIVQALAEELAADQVRTGVENDNNEALMEKLGEIKSNVMSYETGLEQSFARAQQITVTGCGTAGDIVQGALQIIQTLFPGAVRVAVSCGTCTQVRVEVPVGRVQADVRVCNDPSTGQLCVDVQVRPQCTPFLAIPIPLSIPVNGQTVTGNLQIDIGIFGNPCARVQLNLPTCPASG